MFLLPEKADVKAKARFKVKLLPDPEADELAALTVHWLFCSAAPLPSSDGPIHPDPLSFCNQTALLSR